jgi:hypothetical protein
LADVDYDVYAEGEAVLGWLNATFELCGDGVDWRAFANDLLAALRGRFESVKAQVGHVKLALEADGACIAGNLTGIRGSSSVRGQALNSSAVTLTLNARVEMTPKDVEAAVQDVIAEQTKGRIESSSIAWRCLSPGRPTPTYRYDRLIAIV